MSKVITSPTLPLYMYFTLTYTLNLTLLWPFICTIAFTFGSEELFTKPTNSQVALVMALHNW